MVRNWAYCGRKRVRNGISVIVVIENNYDIKNNIKNDIEIKSFEKIKKLNHPVQNNPRRDSSIE